MQTPSNRKGHSAVVVSSAMLVYGGFIDMKGSLQDFWSLDFGALKLQPHTLSHTRARARTHHRLCCNCTSVCDRLNVVVPPE